VEKTNNVELYDLSSSPNVIWFIKSERISCGGGGGGHVCTYGGEMCIKGFGGES
jgi:hypothetical protein